MTRRHVLRANEVHGVCSRVCVRACAGVWEKIHRFTWFERKIVAFLLCRNATQQPLVWLQENHRPLVEPRCAEQ